MKIFKLWLTESRRRGRAYHEKDAFFILSLGILLTVGCAIVETAESASDNVMYTGAPKEVAFQAACEALQKLGYKIETKDTENFIVKGSHTDYWTKRATLYAQIKITQEASGTKIAYEVGQPGAAKALDITGRYSRCADNICMEIGKILTRDEIDYRKARADKQEKQDRALSEDDSFRSGVPRPRRQ